MTVFRGAAGGRLGIWGTSRDSPSGLVGPAGPEEEGWTPGRGGCRERVPWATGPAPPSDSRFLRGLERQSHKWRREGLAGSDVRAPWAGPRVSFRGSVAHMEAKTLGSATPRKPVLSVSARKIKDNAADWHNLILKWETLNDAGFAIANNIANTKISLLSPGEADLGSGSPACGGDAERRTPGYSAELEARCEELQATLAGLTKIQEKMEKLSSTTKGICELENYHYGEDSQRPPLFHTWPTARFYEVARQLLAMYREELLLKRAVVGGLAHTADRDLTLTYLSLWLHQPCVRSDSTLLLESMLLETGHRAL